MQLNISGTNKKKKKNGNWLRALIENLYMFTVSENEYENKLKQKRKCTHTYILKP